MNSHLALFAFLPKWHVKKMTVADTQQMALLPWPLLQHTYSFTTIFTFLFSNLIPVLHFVDRASRYDSW